MAPPRLLQHLVGRNGQAVEDIEQLVEAADAAAVEVEVQAGAQQAVVVDGVAGLDHALIHQIVELEIQGLELLALEGGVEQQLDAIVAEPRRVKQPVEVADAGHRLLGRVGFAQQVAVFWGDHAAGGQPFVEIPLPAAPEAVVFGGEQHQGDRWGAAGLNQGERFEQLIEGAEAPRQYHQGIALPQEEQLAGEEIAKVQQPAIAAAHKAIGVLLERQIDVEADAGFAAGTAVGGLHDAAAGSGHHLEAGFNSTAGQLLGQAVAGVAGDGAGRAEDGDLAGVAMGVKHLQRFADIG